MSRGWVVLLWVVLVGCGGPALSLRRSPDPPQGCVYVPDHEGAASERKEEAAAPRAGMRVVLVAAPAGALPVEPLAPGSSPALEGLSGEGLGDGLPRGVLRLVPEGAQRWRPELAARRRKR